MPRLILEFAQRRTSEAHATETHQRLRDPPSLMVLVLHVSFTEPRDTLSKSRYRLLAAWTAGSHPQMKQKHAQVMNERAWRVRSREQKTTERYTHFTEHALLFLKIAA